MKLYLKGYYGYQNLGDELLLLGLLQRLEKEYHPTSIVIESGDPLWLQQWLLDCKKYVKTNMDNIACVSKSNKYKYNSGYLKVFGGGEVVSDARKFPRNGRTYLLYFLKDIIRGNHIVVGGIGTPKKRGTTLLYKLFLGRAMRVVVRDEGSFSVAKAYAPASELYHDFCYDFLANIPLKKSNSSVYILININRYLWNKNVLDTIRQGLKKYKDHTIYFLPAAWGSDDLLYAELAKELSRDSISLVLLDRKTMSAEELVCLIANADHVFAARLHVLLITQWAGVSFTPFVYQEKIEKVILTKN